jgi:tetratricopeptide (TPR) repeat protein
MLQKIGLAFSMRDYHACEALLDQSEALEGLENTKVWRARLASRQERWPQLLEICDGLLKTNINHEEALFFRARALFRLEQWSHAVEAWEVVIHNGITNADALCEQALACVSAGQHFRVLKILQRAAEVCADDVAMLEKVARTAVTVDALPEAEAMFRHLAKRSAQLLTNNLNDYLNSGQLIGAAVVMAAASETTVDAGIEQTVLADSLLHQAIRAERGDQLREAFVTYSAAGMVLRDNRVSREGCRRAIKALEQELATYISNEDVEGARRLGLDLLHCDPKNFAMRRSLARLFSKAGHHDAAAFEWSELIDWVTDDTRSLREYARALEATGNLLKATEIWARIATLDPTDLRATRALEKLPERMVTVGR